MSHIATMAVVAGENIGHAGEAGFAIHMRGARILQPSVATLSHSQEGDRCRHGRGVRGIRAISDWGLIAMLHVIGAWLVEACELEPTLLGDAADDGSMRMPQDPGLGMDAPSA